MNCSPAKTTTQRHRISLHGRRNRSPRSLASRLSTRVWVAAATLACMCAYTAAQNASAATFGSTSANLTSAPYWSLFSPLSAATVEADVSATAPTSGTITTWRVRSDSATGTAKLLVLHPNGSGHFTITQSSAPQTITTTGLNTFTSSVPVQAGDLIGLTGSFTVALHVGATGHTINTWYVSPLPAAGTALAMPNATMNAIAPAFNADVSAATSSGGTITTVANDGIREDQPLVMSAGDGADSPGVHDAASRSSVAVGDPVILHGAHLNLASTVYFNNVAATTWWIDGFDQITAVVPDGLPAGPVNVRVGGSRGVNEDTASTQIVIAG